MTVNHFLETLQAVNRSIDNLFTALKAHMVALTSLYISFKALRMLLPPVTHVSLNCHAVVGHQIQTFQHVWVASNMKYLRLGLYGEQMDDLLLAFPFPHRIQDNITP